MIRKPMTVQLYIFLAALVLLWLPFPILTNRFKLRALQTRYLRPSPGQVLGYWQNYLDLLRSGAGGFLLIHLALDAGSTDSTPLWIATAVLLVGLLIQMVRLPVQAGLVAPVFYLSSLTLTLSGYLEGGFSVLFGWALAVAGRDLRLQLPGMAAALALIAWLNQAWNELTWLNLGLIGLPLLVALLVHQRLIFISRSSRA